MLTIRATILQGHTNACFKEEATADKPSSSTTVKNTTSALSERRKNGLATPNFFFFQADYSALVQKK